jgi:hypothetical protein
VRVQIRTLETHNFVSNCVCATRVTSSKQIIFLSTFEAFSHLHSFIYVNIVCLYVFVLYSTTAVSDSMLKQDLKSIQNQAVLKFSQRNYAKAEELFKQALDILLTMYDPSHPECVRTEKGIKACQQRAANVGKGDISEAWKNRVR